MNTQEVIEEMIKIDNAISSFNKDIKNKIAELQKQCDHEWIYSYDPSGGSDSGYICNACRLEVKNKPKKE